MTTDLERGLERSGVPSDFKAEVPVAQADVFLSLL